MVASTQRRSRIGGCPGKSVGASRQSGNAAFLDQAKTALDHAVVLRPVDNRVLLAELRSAAQCHEERNPDIRAFVRPETLDHSADVGQ